MSFPVKTEVAAKPKKLLESVHERLRLGHYSLRTEEAYVQWIVRYLKFERKQAGVWKHPQEMGVVEVREFLEDLAVKQNVAASTQNQAFNALLFLYEKVLGLKLGDIRGVARARKPRRLPVVLSKGEVARLLEGMTGTPHLIARLLYGTGMRLMEVMRLRIQDVDFEQNHIVVREGKGDKDRVTMLPNLLKAELQKHLARVRSLHEDDVAAGHGEVHLPHALGRKYPKAAQERSGLGNMFFRRRIFRWTRAQASDGGIIFMRTACRRQSRRQWSGQKSTSRRVAIHSVILSPRIYWRMAMTSARCRIYWVTRM